MRFTDCTLQTKPPLGNLMRFFSVHFPDAENDSISLNEPRRVGNAFLPTFTLVRVGKKALPTLLGFLIYLSIDVS